MPNRGEYPNPENPFSTDLDEEGGGGRIDQSEPINSQTQTLALSVILICKAC